MNARVEWLPVGHIPHGYRRVFTISQNEQLRHVVNFLPMPYEKVFQIREMAGNAPMLDPSLWWGMSVIQNLIHEGVLLNTTNPETADDGYIQLRPPILTVAELVPIEIYEQSVSNGNWLIASE